jgi:hypothetical protein
MKQLTDALRRANAERLRAFYGTDGAMSGMRSNLGPMAAMALSGGGSGARKQEGQIDDRRFGWGVMRNATTGKASETKHTGLAADHRVVRAALISLDSEHQSVLAAAYGEQRRWHPRVRTALLAALPDHYANAMGAALLCERVQRGLANPRERADDIDDSVLDDEALTKAAKRRARARAVTGVIVWLPPQKAFRRGVEERSEVERVADVTRVSLDAAHLAFAEAMGQLSEAPKAKKLREKVNAKPLAIERVMPFGVGEW